MLVGFLLLVHVAFASCTGLSEIDCELHSCYWYSTFCGQPRTFAPTDSSPAVTAQQCIRNTNREDCIFLHDLCIFVPEYGCFPKISFPQSNRDMCTLQSINEQQECRLAFQHKFDTALTNINNVTELWCELAPHLVRDHAKQCVRKCLTANSTFLGLSAVQQWCDNMGNGIGSLATQMRRRCSNKNQTCNQLIAQGLTQNAEIQSLLIKPSFARHSHTPIFCLVAVTIAVMLLV